MAIQNPDNKMLCCNEITAQVDVEQKRKAVQKKMSWGKINSQHVTLNDTTQSPQLWVATDTMIGLA